jgi:peptide-methionine (R)-S-oxide reductase
MKRRSFLGAALGALTFSPALFAAERRPAGKGAWAKLSEADWKARLSPARYAILRQADTERPGTSPLLNEKRKGNFHCAGCDLPLFASSTKFDSGTGWPSFWAALPGAVGYMEDRSLFMVRTEEHCSRCGGHLGHVFDDGPQPTGKRHCINGLALTFRPAGRA